MEGLHCIHQVLSPSSTHPLLRSLPRGELARHSPSTSAPLLYAGEYGDNGPVWGGQYAPIPRNFSLNFSQKNRRWLTDTLPLRGIIFSQPKSLDFGIIPSQRQAVSIISASTVMERDTDTYRCIHRSTDRSIDRPVHRSIDRSIGIDLKAA